MSILPCDAVDNMADESCNVVFLPSVKIETLPEEGNHLDVEQQLESLTEEQPTRFGESSEEEIQRLLEDKNTENTKKATRTAVKIFREYLREKGQDTNFEDLDKHSLNNLLRKFYVEARKRDGDYYKKSALSSIRFALNRHLQFTRNIDIINDPDFRVSAEVFRAQAVELMRRGKGSIDHIADISPEDLKKLYFSDVLNIYTPEGLLRKAFFDLMYLSGSRRSRGNLREQNKNTFGIGEDFEKNMKFIYLKKDDLGLSSYSWKIYEKKGNLRCPVSTLTKYLSKLNPLSDSLWQRPKKNVTEDDDVWYESFSLGHNTLGKMMDTISKEAQLSKVYSNQSLRGSNAAVLDDPTLQNSMLLLTNKLITINGQPFPKIVPKPSSNVTAVIPVVPFVQAGRLTSSSQATTIGPLSTQSNILVLNNPGQRPTTPLNTPLLGATPNQIQVTLTTPLHNQVILPYVSSGAIATLPPQTGIMSHSILTTHVLDTSRGTPARQLPVKVFIEETLNSDSWKLLTSSTTNEHGRVPNLLKPDQFVAGRYKMRFETEIYYKSLAVQEYFYPYVEVVFIITNPAQHYHVPLLLSPFGYSTYRGC